MVGMDGKCNVLKNNIFVCFDCQMVSNQYIARSISYSYDEKNGGASVDCWSSYYCRECFEVLSLIDLMLTSFCSFS
jgi:hypothetical protein